MTLRRLYLYLVSAVSLGLLAAGLALLGNTVLLFVFNDPSAQNSRTQLAGFTAMTAVALPVWAVHFWFARRYAMRDPYERASAIRRLYIYWACLGSAIGVLVALAISLRYFLSTLIDGCSFLGVSRVSECMSLTLQTPTPWWLPASQAAWVAAVFLAIWAFHFWIAARDRTAVGEAGRVRHPPALVHVCRPARRAAGDAQRGKQPHPGALASRDQQPPREQRGQRRRCRPPHRRPRRLGIPRAHRRAAPRRGRPPLHPSRRAGLHRRSRSASPSPCSARARSFTTRWPVCSAWTTRAGPATTSSAPSRRRRRCSWSTGPPGS